MRVLWFSLATDADDTILGFTSRWIRAVARRVERIDVVTMRRGRVDLPANVRVMSLGLELGLSELRRGARFYALLVALLLRERVDVCFSHMAPIFSILAAPVLRPWNVPIVTWYAHPAVHWKVRLAHAVSHRMTTSLPRTLPYSGDKVRVIGQGIDTDLFTPAGMVPIETPPLVLCAGRLSPAKDHRTLLAAVARVRERSQLGFRVVILGDAPPGHETYARSVAEMIDRAGLRDVVEMHPGVAMERLPGWYQRSSIHVNLTPAGFGDKVALEGMSSGRPVIVANDDFRPTLGGHSEQLLFRAGDAEGLAHRLEWLLSLSSAERIAIGADLRHEVLARHSLDSLAARLLTVFGEVA
jgi:glycosyltransferase involved in cell wall biosynthesis